MATIIDKGAYQPRVSGGGNTSIEFEGQPLAFCQTMSEAPAQMHTSATEIQGLNDIHPIRIVPPAGAYKGGTVTLTVKEIWSHRIWEQFGITLATASSRATKYDLFHEMFNQGKTFTVRRVIKNNDKTAIRTYNGCVISDIKEGDTNIQLSSSVADVTITLTYTHYTDTYNN